MVNKPKDTTELNFLSLLMRPQGAYSAILSFFPLARSCEQRELDVNRDFYPELACFKAS
jgi:hypothetical protein